jgi:uroporphyrin-III C-methyltransferase
MFGFRFANARRWTEIVEVSIAFRTGALSPPPVVARRNLILPAEEGHLSLGMRFPPIVSLVGAGPGAADLITVRGLQRLRAADFVLYDALIAPELLEEARAEAERVYVGKRGYCIGSTVQGDINELMIRLTRSGRIVCRLKGGDPCIFGRGGEEAEALAEAGIPFEIIPGVTAALALGAAGIPLTHRATGQSLAFVTGHFDPNSPDCTLDWEALARMSCVVFYMGLRHLSKIVDHLRGAGADADTPAAVVEKLTFADEQIVTGTLADIAGLAAAANLHAPALIAVGEPVRYRQRLAQLMETAASAADHTSGGLS